MNRQVKTTLFLATLAVYACGNNNKQTTPEQPEGESQLAKAEWLLGRWENNSEEGNLSETWTKTEDGSLEAETYFVVGTDTVFREHVRLEEKDGAVNYIANVQGQNGDAPVSFKMTKLEGHTMVFENPKHDYPQVITYEHKGDSVIAEISGNQNGKPMKERFAMKKAQ